MKKGTLIAIGGVALALIGLVNACGSRRDDSKTNSLNMNYLPVTVEANSDLPNLGTGSRFILSSDSIKQMADEMLTEKLAKLNLFNTYRGAETIGFQLDLSDLQGCNYYEYDSQKGAWFQDCDGRFQFSVTLSASSGPDTLDTVSRSLIIPKLTEANVIRYLDWMIGEQLNLMIKNGSLNEILPQTPYWGQTPYYN